MIFCSKIWYIETLVLLLWSKILGKIWLTYRYWDLFVK